MKDLCDDSDNEEMSIFNESKCYKFEGVEIKEGWIGCQMCLRFFDRRCTDTAFRDMTEEEEQKYPFES